MRTKEEIKKEYVDYLYGKDVDVQTTITKREIKQ